MIVDEAFTHRKLGDELAIVDVAIRAADTTTCDYMRVSVMHDERRSRPLTFQEDIVVVALRDRHLPNLEFLGLDQHALLSDRSRYNMTYALTAL